MTNTLKTTLLLGLLSGLLLFIGNLLGGSQGLTIALGLAVLLNFGSYWFSDSLAIKSARAVPVTDDPDASQPVESVLGVLEHDRVRDDAGGDHVVGHPGPVRRVADEIDDVEHDRRGQEPATRDHWANAGNGKSTNIVLYIGWINSLRYFRPKERAGFGSPA